MFSSVIVLVRAAVNRLCTFSQTVHWEVSWLSDNDHSESPPPHPIIWSHGARLPQTLGKLGSIANLLIASNHYRRRELASPVKWGALSSYAAPYSFGGTVEFCWFPTNHTLAESNTDKFIKEGLFLYEVERPHHMGQTWAQGKVGFFCFVFFLNNFTVLHQ